MTNLPQSRWLQVFTGICSARSSLAVAALTGLLLVPGVAFGASLSRTRHALPTALHTTRVSETGSHASGKTHKGTLKSRTGSETSGAARKHGAAERQSGKRGSKGRGKRTEPVDDPVPMFRVHRGSGGIHGTNDAARQRATFARNGRHRVFADGPAPLVSSWRRGRAVPAPRGHSRPEYAEYASVPPVHVSTSHGAAPIERRTPPSSARMGTSASVRYPAPSRAVSASTQAYATGVSHPEDNEPLPRAHGNAGSSADPASFVEDTTPAATVSAAPATPTSMLPHQPAVVQGFGSEVAVPSAGAPSSSDRPGGTHRRNHPSNWTPEPAALTAEPLDESEAITEAAVSPAVLPELYDRSGHLLMRAPLKGSHDVLVHQNTMADNDGLERAQNEADLDRMRAAHLLVALPASEVLHVNEDLPANRRLARPWTVMFAVDIAHAFYQRFHEPIYVTSAVRTVQYQARLQTVNGNAAGLWGDTASPHLTGQAVDMAKRGMSNAELAWMRGYLLPLMQAGKIDVEEEFHQACFHVSVYRSYAAGRRVLQHEVAQVHAGATPVQDAAEVPEARNEQ